MLFAMHVICSLKLVMASGAKAAVVKSQLASLALPDNELRAVKSLLAHNRRLQRFSGLKNTSLVVAISGGRLSRPQVNNLILFQTHKARHNPSLS